MKKIISVVLSIVIILSTLFVASALSFDGFNYRTTLSRDEIIITGYEGTATQIVIPSEIKGLPVTQINPEVFMHNKNITSVEFPATIKTIGDKAFAYCSKISEIDFNKANTIIGINSFYNCSALVTINEADNISKINASAFDGTPWFNNHSDGVVYIGKTLYKFKGTMSSNANITIKDGTVSIGPDAFANQTNLAKISFPTSLKNIGNRAFCGCTSLKSVTLLKHIESIETAAFGFEEVRTGTSISYVLIDGFKIYTEADSAALNYAKLGNVPYEIMGGQLITSIKLQGTLDLGVYETATLTPTILPENASDKKLTWSSSDTAVATVTQSGKVAAISPGSVTITCKTTDGSNLSASCKVTVGKKVESLRLNAATIKWAVGKSGSFKPTITPSDATNKTLSWTSSNPSVATITSSGKLTAKAIGTTTITCKTTDGSNLSATCQVTVGKKVESLKLNAATIKWTVGKSGSFKPTVTPADAINKTLSWTSSNTAVATITSAGKLTAKGVGTAVITCKTTDGSNLSATCRVTVTSANQKVTSLKLNAATIKWAVGKSGTFKPTVLPSTATNKTLKWTSSNPKAVKVDSNGKITAIAIGTSKITCKTTDGSNLVATCVVTVIPKTPANAKAVKAASKTAKITWNTVSGVDGYYVFRATSPNGVYKTVAKTKSASYTDKKLTSGKTYYYKIQAYKQGAIVLYRSTSSNIAKTKV